MNKIYVAFIISIITTMGIVMGSITCNITKASDFIYGCKNISIPLIIFLVIDVILAIITVIYDNKHIVNNHTIDKPILNL
jgi:hypothetical protein